MGVPGCPELASCTASIDSVRMAVMALCSGVVFHSAVGMALVPTAAPRVTDPARVAFLVDMTCPHVTGQRYHTLARRQGKRRRGAGRKRERSAAAFLLDAAAEACLYIA